MRKFLVLLMVLVTAFRPAFAGSMGAAISNVVQMKVAQRTYSVPQGQIATQAQMNAVANDPRFTATVDGLSSAATVVAVGAGTAVVVGSSIAWGPLLVAAGISALVTGAVSLAVGGIKQWLFNSDGTVTASGGASTAPLPTDPGSWYGYIDFWSGYPGPYFVKYFPTGEELCAQMWQVDTHSPGDQNLGFQNGGCEMTFASSPGIVNHIQPYRGDPDPNYVPSGSSSTPVTSTAAAAVADVPASDLSKPLNPVIVANAANVLWQRASASNPNVVPYDAANPVTAADVQAWQAVNPSAYPTVADFVGPASSPGSSSVSVPQPSSNPGTATQALPGTATGTATNTATGQNINISIDWGTFSPPTVDTPSIESILDPLFNMWPDWKNFSFPPHSSSCPTPSFTLPSGVLGGRTIVFNQMCNFLELSNVRPAMQAAFAVAWAILIVFIVMGA